MSSVAKATRSQTDLYLLGDSVTELTDRNLPSLSMALRFFLYHHLELKEAVTIMTIAVLENGNPEKTRKCESYEFYSRENRLLFPGLKIFLMSLTLML